MHVRKGAEFVICVADSGSGDIQAWKVYQTLPDEKAAAVGCIRVVDDSGEDYVYPASQFARLDIPTAVQIRLRTPRLPHAARGEQLKPRARRRTA
jgi:hypothetical protein